MIECVPEIDIGELQPHQVEADGDGYTFADALQYYMAYMGEDAGPHTPHEFASLSADAALPYETMAARHRDHAYAQRTKLVHAMAGSSSHDVFRCTDHDIVQVLMGAVWDLDVYYAYMPERQRMWVYGHPEPIVEIVSAAGPQRSDPIVREQRLRHRLALSELLFRM